MVINNNVVKLVLNKKLIRIKKKNLKVRSSRSKQYIIPYQS